MPTGYEADANCEYCFEQDTCMVVSGRLDQESKAGTVGRPVPDEELDYFERFYTAVEAERRSVHREYAKLREQTPEERADYDRALIGLEPTGRRELDGGRWELRATGTGAVSKIREGNLVLASDGDPVTGNAELARVERLGNEAPRASDSGNGNAVNEEIVVTADEPLDLRRLDVYPSELTTDRLQNALHDAVLLQASERKDVLFGRRDPAFKPVEETYHRQQRRPERSRPTSSRRGGFRARPRPAGDGQDIHAARMVRALVARGDRVLLSAFQPRRRQSAGSAGRTGLHRHRPRRHGERRPR